MCILDSYDIFNVFFFFIVGPSAVIDFVENSNLSTLSNEGKWIYLKRSRSNVQLSVKITRF